ncbi:hypothetical protein BLNAU_23883 [Blattamonas nauphoetae]|uniref:Uncharacterized protein n=1 Tax=Blattamonas nauphoetae TaxID=2049346 RepID=A0ABQ9WT55_9EUKA|nr:hypothetical protein BLNAU_23883 [Blattamonas nauphoetae]
MSPSAECHSRRVSSDLSKRLLSSTKQPPEALPKDVGLPQPIGESYVYLRNSESMRKASLPDIKKIPVEKLENFDQKWEIFFSSPMIPCDVSSATLIFRGDNVTKDIHLSCAQRTGWVENRRSLCDVHTIHTRKGAPNQRHWSQFDVSVACPTVRSPAVKKFRLKVIYPAGSFIPEDNTEQEQGQVTEQNKVKLQIENRVKEQLENKDIYKG